MMKLIILFLISSLLLTISFANEKAFLYDTFTIDNISNESVHKHPELYLHQDSLLRDLNSNLNIMSDKYYTYHDTTRLSFAYHFSTDYADMSKVSGLDLKLLFHSKNYLDFWYGIKLQQTNALYEILSDQLHSLSNDPNAESKIYRDSYQQTMTIAGIGFGHRFTSFLSTALNTRFFEQINVYLNYVTNLDEKTSQKYSGPGYSAEYEFYYRSGKQFFYGMTFMYNQAWIGRKAIDEERLEDRSFVFEWSSLSFELGYYF